jgi:hypothetical protein
MVCIFFCSVVLHRNITIVYAGMGCVEKCAGTGRRGGGGRGTDENDTEKSAKLVIDHLTNKSVHYVSVGTLF